MLRVLLKRWADAGLRRQLADERAEAGRLRAEVESLKNRIRLLEHEQQTAAAILARDRKRVEAETAYFVACAEKGGRP